MYYPALQAWYAFRYVIYELAKTDPAKIKHVQDTWRPIQLRFFQQAERAAAQVEMLPATQADAFLSAVLLNMSTTIQTTLLQLNRTLI